MVNDRRPLNIYMMLGRLVRTCQQRKDIVFFAVSHRARSAGRCLPCDMQPVPGTNSSIMVSIGSRDTLSRPNGDSGAHLRTAACCDCTCDSDDGKKAFFSAMSLFLPAFEFSIVIYNPQASSALFFAVFRDHLLRNGTTVPYATLRSPELLKARGLLPSPSEALCIPI